MVDLTTKMIAKPLADAELGEVGIYMHGRSKSLLFRARLEGNDIGLVVMVGKDVGPNGDYRAFAIREEDFGGFSDVIFFPDARFRPNFESITYSFEYKSLDLFKIGGDNYLVVPLEMRGFWEHAFLNLSSSELLFQLPYSRGRWYFKSWAVVTTSIC